MDKITNYGIISDMHQTDPNIFETAVNVLKSEGADKLMILGDFSGERYPYLHNEDYISYVLTTAAKSNLETFVVPGSHEETSIIEPVLQSFGSKYGNIVKTLQKKIKDHYLVFVPGSDFHPSFNQEDNNFYWIDSEHETGFYGNNQDKQGSIKLAAFVFNPNDLKEYIKDPERTIVFSHIPRAFYHKKAVDKAKFGLVREGFTLMSTNGSPPIELEKGSILPYEFASQILADKYKAHLIEIREENRGNPELEEVLKEIGIKKMVSGHFHESAHLCHDSKGNSLNGEGEGTFTDDMYWNASCLDQGKVGLLTVDDNTNKVAYENINLESVIKSFINIKK